MAPKKYFNHLLGESSNINNLKIIINTTVIQKFLETVLNMKKKYFYQLVFGTCVTEKDNL